MKKINLENIVYKEGDYYVAQSLSVDVSSFGKTKKEALTQLEYALSLYFENLKIPTFQKISKLEAFTFSMPITG